MMIIFFEEWKSEEKQMRYQALTDVVRMWEKRSAIERFSTRILLFKSCNCNYKKKLPNIAKGNKGQYIHAATLLTSSFGRKCTVILQSIHSSFAGIMEGDEVEIVGAHHKVEDPLSPLPNGSCGQTTTLCWEIFLLRIPCCITDRQMIL